MKILELFGGIGACSKALERLKIDYEIVDFVVKTGKASASLLQRKFKIGYNKAATMIDTLEEAEHFYRQCSLYFRKCLDEIKFTL